MKKSKKMIAVDRLLNYIQEDVHLRRVYDLSRKGLDSMSVGQLNELYDFLANSCIINGKAYKKEGGKLMVYENGFWQREEF
jgi:hypothetical protein